MFEKDPMSGFQWFLGCAAGSLVAFLLIIVVVLLIR